MNKIARLASAERAFLCASEKRGGAPAALTPLYDATPDKCSDLANIDRFLRRYSGERPERPMPTNPVILCALQHAQAVLARYVEPGGTGEADTINALLGILDNEALVRVQHEAGPLPIATAAREHERGLLLFCPKQGGWHVGQWWGVGRARWVAATDDGIELEPTHWMAAPADPG